MKIKDYSPKHGDVTRVTSCYPENYNLAQYDRYAFSSMPLGAVAERAADFEIISVCRDALFPYMVHIHCAIPA